LKSDWTQQTVQHQAMLDATREGVIRGWAWNTVRHERCLKGPYRWTREIDGREGRLYLDHEGIYKWTEWLEFIKVREAKVNKDDTCIPFELGWIPFLKLHEAYRRVRTMPSKHKGETNLIRRSEAKADRLHTRTKIFPTAPGLSDK